MTGFLDLIPRWLLIAAIVGLGLTNCTTHLRLESKTRDLLTLQGKVSKEEAQRQEAIAMDTKEIKTLQSKHAAAQQGDVHAYTKEIQSLRVAQAAAAERERIGDVTVAGLRDKLARYSAPEPATTDDAAARRSAEHRSNLLGEHLAEGVELAREAEKLVQELGGLARQRNAEVTLLLGIVRNDRMLCGPQNSSN